MAKATLGRGGKISGITEAINKLEALQKYIRSDYTKEAIKMMQNAAFGMIDNAIYGNSYGTSLAEIFSRTRPRVNGKSVRGRGAGTPVVTGRLQASLLSPSAPYSLYQRNVLSKGGISIRYGGDPQDPKTKEHYFPRPEGMYKFFADGLSAFERANTISKLNSDLAILFSKTVRDQLARKVRSAK